MIVLLSSASHSSSAASRANWASALASSVDPEEGPEPVLAASEVAQPSGGEAEQVERLEPQADDPQALGSPKHPFGDLVQNSADRVLVEIESNVAVQRHMVVVGIGLRDHQTRKALNFNIFLIKTQ